MKLKHYIPIALSSIVTLAYSDSLIAQETPIAQLIEANGKVELKRNNESSYRKTSIGENLYRGDLLKVEKGSRGVIRCTSDSTTWVVPNDGLPRGVANTCSP